MKLVIFAFSMALSALPFQAFADAANINRGLEIMQFGTAIASVCTTLGGTNVSATVRSEACNTPLLQSGMTMDQAVETEDLAVMAINRAVLEVAQRLQVERNPTMARSLNLVLTKLTTARSLVALSGFAFIVPGN